MRPALWICNDMALGATNASYDAGAPLERSNKNVRGIGIHLVTLTSLRSFAMCICRKGERRSIRQIRQIALLQTMAPTASRRHQETSFLARLGGDRHADRVSGFHRGERQAISASYRAAGTGPGRSCHCRESGRSADASPLRPHRGVPSE